MSTSMQQLLVHLDASLNTASRLRIAREIASHQGGAVAAVYADLPTQQSPYVAGIAPAFGGPIAQPGLQRRDAVRETFDAVLREAGPVAEWGECCSFPVLGAFVEQALHADLLVLGHRDSGEERASGLPADFNESVIIDSGKAGLIVPSSGWTREVGQNVAIAWKPTRESARAVAAALPLLQRARRVDVLEWDEEPPPEMRGHRLDLAGWLRQHRVEVQFHREPGTPDELGEILLSRVFELEADLLVMGCYGHSRAREIVLGGVTRTVLRSQTLPVLMAH